jgi:hypothetical protein
MHTCISHIPYLATRHSPCAGGQSAIRSQHTKQHQEIQCLCQLSPVSVPPAAGGRSPQILLEGTPPRVPPTTQLGPAPAAELPRGRPKFTAHSTKTEHLDPGASVVLVGLYGATNLARPSVSFATHTLAHTSRPAASGPTTKMRVDSTGLQVQYGKYSDHQAVTKHLTYSS